jgi:hypothetical protein
MNAEEALLLFAKLRDEGKAVLCSGRLFGVGFLIHGQIAKVVDGEVEIVSKSKDCGVRFTLLADGLCFAYREPRDYPELAKELPEEAKTAMALVIDFPNRGRMPFPERLIIIEAFPVAES